jgi:hypothetical protein
MSMCRQLSRTDPEKTKVVIFLLVAIASTILSPNSVPAQQPAPQATSAVDSNGFPLKAPPGWNQKQWDDTLQSCRHIVTKASAHQSLDPAEFSQSQVCSSLSIEVLMNAHRLPAPGAYLSP